MKLLIVVFVASTVQVDSRISSFPLFSALNTDDEVLSNNEMSREEELYELSFSAEELFDNFRLGEAQLPTHFAFISTIIEEMFDMSEFAEDDDDYLGIDDFLTRIGRSGKTHQDGYSLLTDYIMNLSPTNRGNLQELLYKATQLTPQNSPMGNLLNGFSFLVESRDLLIDLQNALYVFEQNNKLIEYLEPIKPLLQSPVVYNGSKTGEGYAEIEEKTDAKEGTETAENGITGDLNKNEMVTDKEFDKKRRKNEGNEANQEVTDQQPIGEPATKTAEQMQSDTELGTDSEMNEMADTSPENPVDDELTNSLKNSNTDSAAQKNSAEVQKHMKNGEGEQAEVGSKILETEQVQDPLEPRIESETQNETSPNPVDSELNNRNEEAAAEVSAENAEPVEKKQPAKTVGNQEVSDQGSTLIHKNESEAFEPIEEPATKTAEQMQSGTELGTNSEMDEMADTSPENPVDDEPTNSLRNSNTDSAAQKNLAEVQKDMNNGEGEQAEVESKTLETEQVQNPRETGTENETQNETSPNPADSELNNMKKEAAAAVSVNNAKTYSQNQDPTERQEEKGNTDLPEEAEVQYKTTDPVEKEQLAQTVSENQTQGETSPNTLDVVDSELNNNEQEKTGTDSVGGESVILKDKIETDSQYQQNPAELREEKEDTNEAAQAETMEPKISEIEEREKPAEKYSNIVDATHNSKFNNEPEKTAAEELHGAEPIAPVDDIKTDSPNQRRPAGSHEQQGNLDTSVEPVVVEPTTFKTGEGENLGETRNEKMSQTETNFNVVDATDSELDKTEKENPVAEDSVGGEPLTPVKNPETNSQNQSYPAELREGNDDNGNVKQAGEEFRTSEPGTGEIPTASEVSQNDEHANTGNSLKLEENSDTASQLEAGELNETTDTDKVQQPEPEVVKPKTLEPQTGEKLVETENEKLKSGDSADSGFNQNERYSATDKSTKVEDNLETDYQSPQGRQTENVNIDRVEQSGVGAQNFQPEMREKSEPNSETDSQIPAVMQNLTINTDRVDQAEELPSKTSESETNGKLAAGQNGIGSQTVTPTDSESNTSGNDAMNRKPMKLASKVGTVSVDQKEPAELQTEHVDKDKPERKKVSLSKSKKKRIRKVKPSATKASKEQGKPCGKKQRSPKDPQKRKMKGPRDSQRQKEPAISSDEGTPRRIIQHSSVGA